ncbi:hypothetical protein [Campylobacter taeniopygiae]|uniref:Uncharacterized protein n=1 Tax=Campylobacter taeniopygiae TaxID=2510188 RepID=A0ABY2TLU6_9BACT|nr:hypothetical protein [Campylobacter taeniopygiae]TKX33399.1 hypothetical protein CQA75_07580 [Campylobacter taeniopygiae]
MKKIICLLVMIFCTLNADDKDLNLDYVIKDDVDFYYLGKITLGLLCAECLDESNHLPINFSLALFEYGVNPTKNLITNLNTLKDNEYNAFGVELPKNIILEVFEFGEKHKDDFSNLVKQYPFVQLVFSQWLTIKLYEKQKELTNNPNLDYEEFLKNFTSTFNHKSYNLLDAIHQLKVENINHKDDENFNIIDTATALDLDVSSADTITLYDIIYDIIPNSIRKVFLKDENLLKTYLPLNQDQFFYKESILDVNGDYKVYKVSLNLLSSKDYKIDPIIPKAKINKLGIGYDELLELIQNDQTNIKYPEFYGLKVINKTPHGKYKKVILDKKHQSNYKEIVKFSRIGNLYDLSRDGWHWSEDNVKEVIAKQKYDSSVFLIQNNFHTKNLVFESFRMNLRKDKNFLKERVGMIFREDNEEAYPWRYDWIVRSDAFLAYRFNQALALAFLNAYNKKVD